MIRFSGAPQKIPFLFQICISIMVCSSCVSSVDPQKKIYYEPDQITSHNTSVNYTAIMKRTLELEGKELSKTYDTGAQAWITDNGQTLIYSQGNKTYDFLQTERNPDFHEDWDKVYYSKKYIVLESQIKKKNKTITKKTRPNISAEIIDNGHELTYFEKGKLLTFMPAELPAVHHEDWDKFYNTKDKIYGIFKSTKKGIYRLFYKDKNGNDRLYDFSPVYGMLKSTSKAIYRLWYVDQNRIVHSFDYLPTINFICADLTKAYGNVQVQQGIEIASTILLGLIQSYTSYTESTYSGVAYSSYSGVYRDAFGTGSWNGYGTTNFSAYSRTYDYSFVGERTSDLLNSIFKGNASLAQIKSVMQKNKCKCP